MLELPAPLRGFTTAPRGSQPLTEGNWESLGQGLEPLNPPQT